MTICGYIEGVRKNSVVGWAAAVDQESGEYGLAAIEVLLEGKTIARGRADRFRQDLKRDGIGSGGHGFEIPLPSVFLSGGPFALNVRASGPGAPIDLGHVLVLRGEAAELTNGDEIPRPPNGACLDWALAYIRSVSYDVLVANAEEVQADLGSAAAVAYLFGRLLERMPDRGAYESYVTGLSLQLLNIKAFAVDILQSEEYKTRERARQPDGKTGHDGSP